MPTLLERQHTLPLAPKPAGFYIPVISQGNLVFTSGILPVEDGELKFTGPVHKTNMEDAQKAARIAVLNGLSALREELGDLGRIIQVVKLTGFVHAASGFANHPQVMNAASELLVDWFGDTGRHTRSAIGVASLPLNAMVELELIVAI